MSWQDLLPSDDAKHLFTGGCELLGDDFKSAASGGVRLSLQQLQLAGDGECRACGLTDCLELTRYGNGWVFVETTEGDFVFAPQGGPEPFLAAFREAFPLAVQEEDSMEAFAADRRFSAAARAACGLDAAAGGEESAAASRDEDPVAALERQRKERLEREAELRAQVEQEREQQRAASRAQAAADTERAMQTHHKAMRRLSMKRRAASIVRREVRKAGDTKPVWWEGEWNSQSDPFSMEEGKLLAMCERIAPGRVTEGSSAAPEPPAGSPSGKPPRPPAQSTSPSSANAEKEQPPAKVEDPPAAAKEGSEASAAPPAKAEKEQPPAKEEQSPATVKVEPVKVEAPKVEKERPSPPVPAPASAAKEGSEALASTPAKLEKEQSPPPAPAPAPAAAPTAPPVPPAPSVVTPAPASAPAPAPAPVSAPVPAPVPAPAAPAAPAARRTEQESPNTDPPLRAPVAARVFREVPKAPRETTMPQQRRAAPPGDEGVEERETWVREGIEWEWARGVEVRRNFGEALRRRAALQEDLSPPPRTSASPSPRRRQVPTLGPAWWQFLPSVLQVESGEVQARGGLEGAWARGLATLLRRAMAGPSADRATEQPSITSPWCLQAPHRDEADQATLVELLVHRQRNAHASGDDAEYQRLGLVLGALAATQPSPPRLSPLPPCSASPSRRWGSQSPPSTVAPDAAATASMWLDKLANSAPEGRRRVEESAAAWLALCERKSSTWEVAELRATLQYASPSERHRAELRGQQRLQAFRRRRQDQRSISPAHRGAF
eukprot:Hpha_TRINITY_DN16594_c2_g5::TRINITY_DN16594_c2_g5_i1::g.136648::m.136648